MKLSIVRKIFETTVKFNPSLGPLPQQPAYLRFLSDFQSLSHFYLTPSHSFALHVIAWYVYSKLVYSKCADLKLGGAQWTVLGDCGDGLNPLLSPIIFSVRFLHRVLYFVRFHLTLYLEFLRLGVWFLRNDLFYRCTRTSSIE